MLIEVRVQLNGTLRQDIDRVSHAIATARLGMRAPDSMTVFGPRWGRDEYGHICAVRYRCSDLHPAGNMRGGNCWQGRWNFTLTRRAARWRLNKRKGRVRIWILRLQGRLRSCGATR